MAILLVGVACGGESNGRGPDGSTGSSTNDSAAEGGDNNLAKLDFLRFTEGGFACFSDCATRHGVEAPQKLVLEDAEGTLEFEISAEEFEEIEALARSSEFGKEVADSLAGRDCFGFDVLLSMTYQWQGEPAQDVPHVDDCGIREGYVLRDLVQYIHRLQEEYLECPPWQEPRGFNLATDPLPQRPLCWFCYGKCGGGLILEPGPPLGSDAGGSGSDGKDGGA